MIEPMPEYRDGPPQNFRATMFIPLAQNPLSLNKKLHWAPEAKLIKQWRTFAALNAARWPQLPYAEVTLTWHVTDAKRRDEDNMFGLLKPLADGLVDAGVVPDDTPRWMGKRCRIVRAPLATRTAFMVLTVEYETPTAEVAA